MKPKLVQAPYEYRLSPFVVRVYTAKTMAAAKVNALLSENRNVPHDIYDLHDLVQQQVDPSALWIALLPKEVLQRKRAAVWAKIDGIKFDQAFDELLPNIAPGIRVTIDESRWDVMRANVAGQVDKWLEAAISTAKPAQEMNRDPKSDADLAGR